MSFSIKQQIEEYKDKDLCLTLARLSEVNTKMLAFFFDNGVTTNQQNIVPDDSQLAWDYANRTTPNKSRIEQTADAVAKELYTLHLLKVYKFDELIESMIGQAETVLEQFGITKETAHHLSSLHVTSSMRKLMFRAREKQGSIEEKLTLIANPQVVVPQKSEDDSGEESEGDSES